MTDHKTIASRYIDLWNERTPQPPPRNAGGELDQRTPDTSIPLMSGDGHDGVDALIIGRAAALSGFQIQLIGEPNGFGDHVRFSWGLGPDGADSPIKGTDFAVLRGRPHPQHHRVPRSGAAGRVTRA